MPSHAAVRYRVDRTTRVIRWLRRIGMVFLVAAAGLMMGSVAHAFWSAGGAGLGLAATGTLPSPSNVVVSSPQYSNSVTVTWDAPTLTPSGSINGYWVTRTPVGGGVATAACGTSSTTLTSAVSCTDLNVPDGNYRYVVTAVLGSWTTASAPSSAVTVRRNVDAPSVSATQSPAPNVNGYNKVSPVTLQLSATDSDGIASISYSINGGAAVTVNAATASIPLSGDGTYTVTYSAVDGQGRPGSTSTRVVRIDSVAPATPPAPTLVASSDSGTSSTDRLTNVRTPTFTGTAEPGATVRLFSSGTEIGTAVASVSGSYTVTSNTLLTEGLRSITVRAVDLADNLSAASPATQVTIDLTGPDRSPAGLLLLTDTGRSSTDLITADNTPDIFGSARNSGADRLHLYAGGVEQGSATATPTATITASLLGDGSHTLTMLGSDDAGNLSDPSDPLTITIDTAAPAAPSEPVLAAGSDTGASSSDRVTSDNTPTVTGSNEPAAIVTLFAGSTLVGTQTTAGSAYSVTTSALADGNHTLTATATDVAGNVGPASPGTAIMVDTTAPTAPSAPVLTADSDSGVSSSDRSTNDNTPTFTGTATTGTNVTLLYSGIATGATVNAPAGSWTATTGALPDGTHLVTARTDPDAAGNIGISPSTTVTIDTVAPATPVAPALATASDSGRSSSDLVTNVTTPTFHDTGSVGVAGVVLYDGGVEVGTSTASPSYMVTASARPNGTRAFTVRTHDAAGNMSVSSAVRSVTIDTVAPAAPSAPVLAAGSDTGASSTDRITNDNTPTVTGSNEASAIVTLFAGAAQVGAETTASAAYSVTASTLADGNHTLSATATDVAGNVGPPSSGTAITVDTVAPAAPSAPVLATTSDSGVSSSDRITNDTTPTLSGTASAGSNVRIFDGDTAAGSPVAAGGGSWTATTSALGDGNRILTARTDPDLAGNVGISPSITVTVDSAAPTPGITVDSALAVRFALNFGEIVHGFASSDVHLSGTANPLTSSLTGTGATYTVTVDGMDRSGTVVVNVPAGQVTDTAGNTNVASTSNTNVINYTDTVAPTVAITRFDPAAGQTAVIEGTAGTGRGDGSTVTVVLCTGKQGDCPTGDTRATLTATVDPATGAWSVTSGTLGATSQLYARAQGSDLSGNTRLSPWAGPISIPAAAPAAAQGDTATGTGAAGEKDVQRFTARSDRRQPRRSGRRAIGRSE